MDYYYRHDPLSGMQSIKQTGFECRAATRTTPVCGMPQETYEAQRRDWEIPPDSWMWEPRLYVFCSEVKAMRDSISMDQKRFVTRFPASLFSGLPAYYDGMVPQFEARYFIFRDRNIGEVVVPVSNIEVHHEGCWIQLADWSIAK